MSLCCVPNPFSGGVKSVEMDDHDLELEKARLLSLALDVGFDQDSASKCLDRLVHLYGNVSPFLIKTLHFHLPIIRMHFLCPRFQNFGFFFFVFLSIYMVRI